VSATGALEGAEALRADRAAPRSAVWSVFRAERRKLASLTAIRLLALVCLLGPFGFAAVLKSQTGSPADTLFGAWVHGSGFAVSLVVLGFAGSWGFPLVAGIAAGDIFSAEDRYGTWKTVLTRACTRRELFVGKLLAAAAFTLALVLLTAVSSLAAGVLLVGDQSLVNLSGTLFSPGRSLGLVFASWLLSIPPTLAFAALAVLFSVATRNGIVGVLGPSLVALVMQLLALVGAGTWVHMLLVASAFNDWHALFTVQPYYGPLLVALAVSLVWIAACLGVSWSILRRRDFAGPPVARRRGWGPPLRIALAFAALIALLAFATNWGPAGVTAGRLQASITPAFNNLTIMQQRLLGRTVPAGAHLNVRSHCTRRASTPQGPGEWACTLAVFIPQPGAVPYETTPVTYDVSVQSDGCYKAESPPSFVGQQTMRDEQGHSVVNPLFTIYGCFNPI
jgi:ABC-2 type transport system permease protein